MTKQEFIVIDTEGQKIITEIAIINSEGKLIYEAHAEEYCDRYESSYHLLPLKQILLDLISLSQNKLIVCHYAQHDRQIIKNSFAQAGIPWHKFQFACTWLLSKKRLYNLTSYSLEYLSHKLNLKVNNQYFSSQQAHIARYDAAFTYQLYCHLNKTQITKSVISKPNPFSSSRVDHPFQSHPDLTSIHQEQFIALTSIITDIKYDPNHQSKGAVVIGEPGTGKTHLMMRLANELLENNRLLFIRQPNNAETIIYHTYSRILESLTEKVAQTGYTQLEYLLANSFTHLISKQVVPNLTQKDNYIIQNSKDNPLSIYPTLGKEGTAKKREYWQHIERRTADWWLNKYGGAGYSLEIVKGIIKYCSYSDPTYKKLITRWLAADNLEPEEIAKIGLNNWQEEMSKEAFSLEAIAVFGRLSLLDKPLIIIFDQLEGLGLEHNRNILLNFGEAIKETFTHVPNSLIILNLFPDRWQQFQEIFDGSIIDRVSQHQIILNQPSPIELKQILQTKAQALDTNINNLFNSQELTEITSQNSIRAALNKAYNFYRYRHNQPNKIAQSEIATSSELAVIRRIESLEKQVYRMDQLFQSIAEALATFQASSSKPLNEPQDSVTSISITKEHQTIIDYLETQKAQLETRYNLTQIIDDNDDIGKLKTIVEAFKTIKNIETEYLRLGKKKLPEHIVIKTNDQSICVGFLQISGSPFTTRIKNFNSLVIANKDIKFILLRDSRQPAHSGKIGKEEILKLNHAFNGNFSAMGKDNRLNFELIYQLLIDIQNQDLDVSLDRALPIISSHFKDYWLVKLLTF